MELQETQNNQNDLEKEQSWRAYTFLFQKLLQNHGYQNNVVLAYE